MSVDVTSSPYAAPLVSGAEDGLGYSRHYAQRIRDMGKTSKESWIKRLWNHVFQKRSKELDNDDDDGDGGGSAESGKPVRRDDDHQHHHQHHHPDKDHKQEANRRRASQPHSATMGNSVDGTALPPIAREGSLINVQQTGSRPAHPPKDNLHVQFSSRSGRDQHDQRRLPTSSAPATGSQSRTRPRDRLKAIPAELAYSPYLAPKDRAHGQGSGRDGAGSRSHNSVSYQRRQRDASRDQFYVRKPVHPYLSQHQDVWRPKITRAPNMINLEKRAKATADKAMKEAKIFTCVGPYPVDAYVRFSLRKRGWVEKFGPNVNATTRNGTSTKLECECDEDFEVICDRAVPAPWDEDHGIYAIMSRCARHYPAKFIWGGRSVTSLILKNEVTVNHFPKARYFSSKVLLAQSLKDLPWQNDVDPATFFPRCYVLGEEEKADIIDDFRTTACIALLKWILRMYLKGHGRSHHSGELLLQRENTKYEEITSLKDCEDGAPNAGSIFDDIVTPEPSARGSRGESDRREMEAAAAAAAAAAGDEMSQDSRTPCACRKAAGAAAAAAASSSTSHGNDDSALSSSDDGNNGDADYEPCADVDGATNVDGASPQMTSPRVNSAGNIPSDKPKDVPQLRRSKTMNQLAIKQSQSSSNGAVLPNLKEASQKKRGGEVPLKAAEWALFHLNLCIKSKNHEDIDLKTRGLSQPQWDQLLSWFYDVSQNGAKVPITEGKLRECEEMLRKMKKVWPQYEIDGKRNIWIIKPGDKSKGIGIEFASTLDNILKYITNSTTQGTYVIQKYIERPLLLYRCKFDIRQWFLVTDWNPLTIWFYKESYLRICSQEFQYDTMHESVHLSNVAVQQNYLNGARSDKLPDNNFLSSTNFKKYLSEIGAGHAWNDIIYPGMKHAVINTLKATQEVTENRKNAFELYGADFMLSEDYSPWLIEINASPGMSPTSIEKCKLCAKVIDDTIRVVIDRRENKNAATGDFEMAFKDNPVAQTKCVETKLILEGQRIRKNDLQRYYQLDQKNIRREQDKQKKAVHSENKEQEIAENGQVDSTSGDSDGDTTEKGETGEEVQEKSSIIHEQEEWSEENGDQKENKKEENKKEENKKEEKDVKKGQKNNAKKKEDPLKDSPYNKPLKKELDTARSQKVRDEKKKGKK